MSGADFLDTNVLIYSVDAASPSKRDVAKRIVADALIDRSAVISFQVVQEALQALTRKVRVVAHGGDVREFLDNVLVPLWQVQPSLALYQRALHIQGRHGLAFHDSVVVAAALEAGCKRLLSEDMQHGQKIEGLRVENPFRA